MHVSVNLQAITRNEKLVLLHVHSSIIACCSLWNTANCSSSSLHKFWCDRLLTTLPLARHVASFHQWSRVPNRAVNLASKQRNVIAKDTVYLGTRHEEER
ncbi:hypothetical protein B7P43_G09278 [Cryptotermes secundus]|uniref:Uncharacterized protein n=1 Tax=Cryptotermes secundus TaxID=105785 RepID=A0A2J7Q5W0_9NEOP|nr:hypothetical protein B7P43_G09278 [Cryptotermes secundus]